MNEQLRSEAEAEVARLAEQFNLKLCKTEAGDWGPNMPATNFFLKWPGDESNPFEPDFDKDGRGYGSVSIGIADVEFARADWKELLSVRMEGANKDLHESLWPVFTYAMHKLGLNRDTLPAFFDEAKVARKAAASGRNGQPSTNGAR